MALQSHNVESSGSYFANTILLVVGFVFHAVQRILTVKKLM